MNNNQKEYNGQLSLFDYVENSDPDQNVKPQNKYEKLLSEPVSVSYSTTIARNTQTPLELFSGFDTMRIVTFSYSLKWIEAIVASLPFRHVEIIYGMSYMVGTDVCKLMADQNGATDYQMMLGNQAALVGILDDYPILQQKSRDGIIKMMIPDGGFKTHEKIYLLENSETGENRTILGSANASVTAWNGSQGEFRDVRDNDSDYKYRIDQFNDYIMKCSSVGKSAKLITDEDGNPNLLDLPVAKKTLSYPSANGLLLREVAQPTEEEKDFAIHVKKMSGIAQSLGADAVKIKPAKDGAGYLKPKDLIAANKKIISDRQDQKKKRILYENPEFIIDYNNGSVLFDQKPRNLSPDVENIKNDLENLNRIFNGFETFIQERPVSPVFWRVMNYMFAAPFMPKLRNTASCSGVNKSMYLPGCCLVRGASNAAKTKTIRAFQKMMLGVSLKPSSNKEFAEQYIRGARQTLKGIPVVIDEVKGSRFKATSGTCMAENIAKLYTENYGVSELNPTNEPCFIATSNAAGFINVQTQKRMPVFTIDGHCSRVQALESDDTYERIIKSLTTALYDAYCGKMLNEMDQLLDGIRKPAESGSGIDDADIYAVGSKIVLSLYEMCGVTPPESFVPLTWRDIIYVDTSKAEYEITDIYSRYPGTIHADKRRNELTLDLSQFNKNSADYYVDLFMNESPDSWRVKTGIGTEIIFTDLEAVENTLNICFGSKFSTSGIAGKIAHAFKKRTS